MPHDRHLGRSSPIHERVHAEPATCIANGTPRRGWGLKGSARSSVGESCAARSKASARSRTASRAGIEVREHTLCRTRCAMRVTRGGSDSMQGGESVHIELARGGARGYRATLRCAGQDSRDASCDGGSNKKRPTNHAFAPTDD